jgi:outer membrane lipoprotein-sorting protein
MEALGAEEALAEIKSLKFSGILEFPSSGIKYNLTIYKMRPNLYRCDKEYRGTKVVEAYDGNNVWHVVPFDGIYSPRSVKDKIQASKIKSEADIFSPLFDWKAKGYKVEYLGEKAEENQEWLKLKVTFNDNYTTDYFLDSQNYLVSKHVRLERHNPRGRTNIVTTHIRDYRRISSVWFAHRYEIEKGTQKLIITIERIHINPNDITSSLFSADSYQKLIELGAHPKFYPTRHAGIDHPM